MKIGLSVLVVSCVVVGAAFALNDDEIQVKAKYGSECHVVSRCGDMMYVDCGAAWDGPAYYLDKDLEVIGTSGGLCMGGNCSGAPKEWTECDGRQSDGPSNMDQ
ncbi:MAG TPA: hypothetical protein PKI93_06470 [Alphaproteobacteria bacterium]|nr:hypothetical protein [Alphaproteobacteria bacterium]HNS44053.1 hypothetical protein [Alphaproteobacteria bacterium]